ncbi:hypothetical protein A134_23045 [Vibrio crassostreae 9CS106]|uniref:Uncharacterized protein n=1 Tax=Vibrio crassostreae 9CS106 TaxID=1191300 RepID=A0A1B1C3C4_9VIBR|nr:hypothetical protein A134_23045 [Vibrio crassostreae 9CS106]
MSNSFIWDVINPSDPVTIKGNDHLTVAVAVCLLGKGHYGAEAIPRGESSLSVPLFLFGNIDDWFVDNFDKTFEECLESADMVEVSKVLDSAAIGNCSIRIGYDKIMARLVSKEERDSWREEFHDKERSSTNNICGRAWSLAELLRTKEEQE